MRKYINFMYNEQMKFGFINGNQIHCVNNLTLPVHLTNEIIEYSDKVKVLPIVPDKVICIGLNYKSHAEEFNLETPLKPVVFSKSSNTIATNNQHIFLPSISKKVEFEGEIGVIIGSEIYEADEEEASKAILGIVAVNDVTARDYQEITGQWFLAKSFDTFLPIGNQILEYSPITYSLEVYKNDILMQKSDSNDLIFSIPFLISYISSFMTLNPGDLICTGTPSGDKSIVNGDVVRVVINNEVFVENTFVKQNNRIIRKIGLIQA